MAKCLRVFKNPPIKYFLHHALPLSMILTESKNNNFLYANFIQVYKNQKDNYLFEMYPRIGSGDKYGSYPIDNVIENHIITGNIVDIKKDEIIEYMMKWIDEKYYVCLTSDERYIKGTIGYKEEKFHKHQGCYIGYDSDKKVMKMLNYNQKNEFGIIDISFDDVIKSFISKDLSNYMETIGFRNYLIQLKRVNQKVLDEKFTDEKTVAYIKKYIYQYLCSSDSSKDSFFEIEGCIWGIRIYDILEKSIRGEVNNSFMYQCFCGQLEHKVLMERRMEYLKELGYGISEEMVKNMQETVNIFTTIRNKVLKYFISNDNRALSDCSAMLATAKKVEMRCLEQLLNVL